MTSPALSAALALAASAALLHAHGGQYRGPGNVTPPAPTATASSPTASTGNGTGGTATSQPVDTTKPARGATPPTGAGVSAASRGPARRGVMIDEDLGRWEFWWEFGKDPYLQLRESIRVHAAERAEDRFTDRRLAAAPGATARPTKADLDEVVSQLEQILGSQPDRDAASACMVALAKIGAANRPKGHLRLLAPYLAGSDQELRETAALALGIQGLADDATLSTLVGLVRDDESGRRTTGDVAVNERTRAFAAYALGLLRRRIGAADLIEQIDAPLRDVLAEPTRHGRDLKVAAVEALGLANDGQAIGDRLHAAAKSIQALGDYYRSDLGAGEHLLQAHCPPAIARQLAGQPRVQAYWRDLFRADLAASLAGAETPPRAGNAFVAQSCAIALGELCEAWTAAEGDTAACASLLLDCYRRHKDQQTRCFALMALARIGGDRARDALLAELRSASKALERPWVAMALGVWTARRAAMEAADPQGDREVADALAKVFQDSVNPNVVGAIGIALGLAGDADLAGPMLRRQLSEHRNRDDAAGYLALALGLLRDRTSIADVRGLLTDASRRPFVVLQCSRALGLMNDDSVAPMLCAQLQSEGASLVRLSAAAAALGTLGDRRSIPLLLQLARDAQQPALSRAFAIVALGSVCDDAALPWNAAYASPTNYRAAVDTLTDGARGILDIL